MVCVEVFVLSVMNGKSQRSLDMLSVGATTHLSDSL